MIMHSPVVLANVSYAQLPEPTIPSPEPSSLSTLPDNAVTITSPQDGQKIPVGQNLQVTGRSMVNTASDCKITVSLNRVKPS